MRLHTARNWLWVIVFALTIVVLHAHMSSVPAAGDLDTTETLPPVSDAGVHGQAPRHDEAADFADADGDQGNDPLDSDEQSIGSAPPPAMAAPSTLNVIDRVSFEGDLPLTAPQVRAYLRSGTDPGVPTFARSEKATIVLLI